MFNLNIKSGGKRISYKPLSVSLKYFIEEEKLKGSLNNFEKIFNIKLTALQKKSFLSKNGLEIRAAKHGGKPDEIRIIKVKVDEKFSVDYFRNHLTGFIQSIENEAIQNLHIFIPKYSEFKTYFKSEEYFYQTFAEGIYFGNYTFDKYFKEKKQKKQLNIFFYADDEKKLKSAIDRSKILMDAVYFTRDLQNEPSGSLTPELFAKRVKSRLSKLKIRISIYNERDILRMGMGGLMAVGQGSDNPPRFIVLEYNSSGTGKKSGKKPKKIALVGKGVTFDTGGISIKPAKDMGEMKADMSGAAVVAGTVLASAQAKLPVSILGVIPSAENMISGNAMRPGDIVITSSGKSIEVDNTDAEGRMILADALNYASNKKPDVIIDLATLTGSCVVALGEFVAGLFTKDDKLAKKLYELGLQTYDRVWRLPLWDDYFDQIKSDVADVRNIGITRWGDAINAAKFLEFFVDKNIPWVHLDIAGPAMANNFNNYSKKYMTGYGVRLLFEYLSELK
jgi:leucyl aminopeptidase